MDKLATRMLPPGRDAVAPDGSEVRILLGLAGGGMAHFRLPSGATSVAVRHRTVEEIWYVVAGSGEMWRSFEGEDRVDRLEPGLCLTVPLGAAFQFRSLSDAPLDVVGVTMPPWPGSGEAVLVDGRWEPTLTPGPL
jgi:mannose-6-phosphate isomerase-like protein (cupin superfamily)